MEKLGWKIIAIIFIFLFIIENLLIGWGVIVIYEDEEKENQCYYEVCKDYPEATFDSRKSLCTCYDYDNLGNYVEAEYKIMK